MATRSRRTRGKGYLWIALLTLIVLSFGIMLLPGPATRTGRPFHQDATLSIFRSASEELLTDLAVEIANDETSIIASLTNKRTFGPRQGVLFVLPAIEVRALWKPDAAGPVDLLLVGADRRVIRGEQNLNMADDDFLTDEADAVFLLEVNAGFVADHSILPGDRLEW